MTAAASPWPARIGLVTALAVGAGLLTLLPGGSPSARAEGLVPWSDCDAMLRHYRTELVRTATAYGVGDGVGVDDTGGGLVSSGTAAVAEAAAPAAARLSAGDTAGGGATGGAVGTGPTGTNLQEAGVDEPDTAKLAGGLVVQLSGGRLHVVRGGAQPQLLSSVGLGDGVGGGELLVDGTRVLVVATVWEPVEAPEPLPGEPEPLPVEPGEPVEPQPGPDDPTAEPLPKPTDDVPPVDVTPTGPGSDEPVVTPESDDSAGGAPDATAAPALGRAVMSIALPGAQSVRLVLVDLADPAAPRVVETLDLDGRYVSARLVGGTVRLVTASSPQVPVAHPTEPGTGAERAAAEVNRDAAASVEVEDVLPTGVRRDGSGRELSSAPVVECADVQRAADQPHGVSTLVVTTLRPSTGLAPLDSTAVTTDGDLVYASADRLYVTTSRWGTVAPAASDIAGAPAPAPDEVTTQVHAFDTSAPDATAYVGSGSVRGWVYGRWAFSEHDGHLRVATTLQPPWGEEAATSSSVVVLAEEGDRLVERGRVDGLGPGERIYAVRYFGDIATVVTFRETDPLYVLDLADPARPRVLGELKIPGFSTYLHPVGDDRLLGVGQDADATGRVTGFQLSLFDLRDLSKPVQVDRLSLGEGWSSVSEDSRAFGYDPQRRLAVLPFTSYSQRTGLQGNSALGVRVTPDFRLEEVGRLDVGAALPVERVLLGGDVLYAVTQGAVVAADPTTFSTTGTATLPGGPAVGGVEGGGADGGQ
ncbi:MAG TPA: beta-propeller domain-containing protein, partial [Mycobacteriales bacterium]|nr:beta-propeller domain-containing protein [Mycobacteriales bacterium]